MTTRDQILEAFRAAVRTHHGTPPSSRAFFDATELSVRDLHRVGWPTYGALLESEGFAAQGMRKAFTDQDLFEPLANLTRALGHFPTQNEREVERHRNPAFPSTEAYLRRASGEHLRVIFQAWLEGNATHEDISKLLGPVPAQLPSSGKASAPVVKGYVYMVRSGRLCKIGRETTAGARQAVAGTWIEHPEVLHRIATADPEGVEAYWHQRFKKQGKHVKGELFDLAASDIMEFKRWKKIV